MLNTPSSSGSVSVAAGVTQTIGAQPYAVKHQIKINKDTATTGTVTLTAKVAGASAAETVYDNNGVAIVFNAASSTPQSYIIEGVLDSLILTPSALDGTYKYTYTAW